MGSFKILVFITIMVLITTKISDAGVHQIPPYELLGINSLDLTQHISALSSPMSLPHSISSSASYSSEPSANSHLTSTSTSSSSSVSLPVSSLTSTPAITPSGSTPLRLSSSTHALVPSSSATSLPFSNYVPTSVPLFTTSTTPSSSFKYIPKFSSRLIPTPARPSTPNSLHSQGSTYLPNQSTVPTPLHLLSSIGVPFSASSSVPLTSDLVSNSDLTSISESILYELLLELLNASIDDSTDNILESD